MTIFVQIFLSLEDIVVVIQWHQRSRDTRLADEGATRGWFNPALLSITGAAATGIASRCQRPGAVAVQGAKHKEIGTAGGSTRHNPGDTECLFLLMGVGWRTLS